ncbi:PQQ-dependent sugar dehydrogenase [Pedobacter jejuensis]|uniref:PKD domain-containing protein n=1 Tax=Pedobacter jejuensis TaxID=1268550 RepID=A0A3N0BU68_9SPHI|nr:PQQ-dependent sugar dehydrogenase [Pedobacter jejuensis]RNL52420.1 PKD domain-containing protein [Pedobacter jejuensis]
MKTVSTILLSGIAFTLFLSSIFFNKDLNSTDKINLGKDKILKIDTPDQDRFVKVNLVQGEFTEPTEMSVLPNLDILVAQRRGELMLYQSQTKKLIQIAKLDVYSKTSVADVNAEEGLLGLTIDPQYASNQYVYLFYSPTGKSVNRLSRFKMVNDMLSMSSEKIILEFYSQREICCHTGGSLAFGPDRLLYISTGDNSTPFDVPKQQFVNKGYAPLDNRAGLEQYDSRRSAGNTNDLRGKVLRIKVEENGTYTIPDGNLFPKGTEKTKPEIYVMGNRNPYRISVDKKTGFLYWGEVGPDASNDDELRGPKGYDEVNQARKAGNFGWPYFIGNNYPYKAYDYTNGTNGPAFDAARAINNSPNNTGLGMVPAAQPAFIWYPYGESKEFPQVGSGGRTAMAGPVLYTTASTSPYPAYYNGKLIIYEWVRGWVKAVTMAPNGDYVSMEPFMANIPLAAPIDMELGPDGKIYILEYGKGWFSKNPDAGIVRIDYLKGNRPPVVSSLEIAKPSGLLPYKMIAKVKATDADGGKLIYIWNLGGGLKKTTTVPEIQHTFTKIGEYPISVQVIDSEKAASKSQVISVFAGNEHPKVDVVLTGNKSFYFPGKAINYKVLVSDKGAIVNKEQIYISSAYTEGSDLAGAQLGHQQAAQTMVGKTLMAKSDCSTCHKVSSASIGPAFDKISTKYQQDPKAIEYLASKVIKGSSGVWGEVPMPAHPSMKESEVKQIVEWVLSLSAKGNAAASLPTVGTITPPENINKNKPVLTLKASYTDLGAKGLKPLTTTNTYNLKGNIINSEDIKEFSGFIRKSNNSFELSKSLGWLKLNSIDLTDVKSINITPYLNNDCDVELRLDKLDGQLIGNLNGTKSIMLNETVTDKKFHNVFIIFKPKGEIKNRFILSDVTIEAK